MVKEEYSIEDIKKLKQSLLNEEKIFLKKDESSINKLVKKKVK